jgi:hypothetical protein
MVPEISVAGMRLSGVEAVWRMLSKGGGTRSPYDYQHKQFGASFRSEIRIQYSFEGYAC